MMKEDIIKQLKAMLHGPLWLDEHFDKKLNSISGQKAFVIPHPNLHSVAELLSHLNVWFRACMDRMNGIENGLKDNSPDDWKSDERLKIKGWEALKTEFYNLHDELIRLIETKEASFFEQTYHGSSFSHKDILYGLIHHNAYHLGQMGLSMKFLKQHA
jgi:uncharacterized damage-inducible protein DinB